MCFAPLRRGLLRCVVAHSGNLAAGYGPQVQACHTAVGAEPAAVLLEQLPVDFAMVIHHAKPSLDGQVVVTEDVRALHAEEQYHFRRPDANALQGAELLDGFIVGHIPDALQVEFSRMHLAGEIGDIFRFTKRHAGRLKLFDACIQDSFSVYRA